MIINSSKGLKSRFYKFNKKILKNYEKTLDKQKIVNYNNSNHY